MEIGARVCTPRKPVCGECPLHATCRGRLTDATLYPAPKAAKAKRPAIDVQCVVVENASGATLIARRPDSGLLKGQNELVCVEGVPTLSGKALLARLKALGVCAPCSKAAVGSMEQHGGFKHVFSHLEHNVTVWHAAASADECTRCALVNGVRWTRDVKNSGLTSAMVKSLKVLGRL